ncbi:MAG: hypothetical protein KJ879_00870 [Nanoarchaeota archaeon]|nr:hypothetical protein [Nanoarchaeota archaeon]
MSIRKILNSSRLVRKSQLDRTLSQLDKALARLKNSRRLRKLIQTVHETARVSLNLDPLPWPYNPNTHTEFKTLIENLRTGLEERLQTLETLPSDLAERLDPETGLVTPTSEEIQSSPIYKKVLVKVKSQERTYEKLIATLKQGLRTAKNRIDTYKTENTELKKRLVLTPQETSETGSFQSNPKLAEEVLTLREKNRDLENEKAALENRLAAYESGANVDETLQKELAAKTHLISSLRSQVDRYETEMATLREKMYSQLSKLSQLISGELKLLPSEQLDEMNSDALLEYARDVARDYDVCKQTLDTSLEGFETIQTSVNAQRDLYASQEQELLAQIETMRAELDSNGNENYQETIETQRTQLAELESQITGLNKTNTDLQANLELYTGRLRPLIGQNRNLEVLRDTLVRYIRQNHERGFSLEQLE